MAEGTNDDQRKRSGRRTVPARIRWAIRLLEPRPGERVLEIGGGPGALAELACPRLDDGLLLAVERSATAIARSVSRNQHHVDAGTLRHIQSSLADLRLATASVDKAVAVNVNLFWTTRAITELDVVRRALKPGGCFLVLYGSGPSGSDVHLQTVHDNLTRGGFADIARVTGPDGSGVIARRS